jgi:predicted RNase H-like HicB family nuclease
MVTFRIEPDGNEFHAWSPELPGVHTHGGTRAHVLKNLKDAVKLCLDDCLEGLSSIQTNTVMAGPVPAIH